LEEEVWPMHPGLRAAAPTAPRLIHALGEHRITNLDIDVVAAPVATGEIILVPAHGGGIIVLDISDGKPLGRIDTPGPIEVTPAINSGFLFVAAGSRLIAFDLLGAPAQADEIKPCWTADTRDGNVTQPLVAGHRALYFVTGGRGRGALHALSQASDGQRLWPQPLVFDSELLPPVMLREHLVVISGRGELRVLDPADGRVLASGQASGGRVDTAVLPFVVEDHVLFADTSGNVYKLTLEGAAISCNYLYGLGNNARISCIAASRDYIVLGHSAGVTLLDAYGNRRWQDTSSEAVTVPPVLTGDTLFVVDDLGNAVLYDAAQGNPTEKRRRLFEGESSVASLIAGDKLAAVNSEGKVALIEWV
jgi:outer membrane protein assembly factor BamB